MSVDTTSDFFKDGVKECLWDMCGWRTSPNKTRDGHTHTYPHVKHTPAEILSQPLTVLRPSLRSFPFLFFPFFPHSSCSLSLFTLSVPNEPNKPQSDRLSLPLSLSLSSCPWWAFWGYAKLHVVHSQSCLCLLSLVVHYRDMHESFVDVEGWFVYLFL